MEIADERTRSRFLLRSGLSPREVLLVEGEPMIGGAAWMNTAVCELADAGDRPTDPWRLWGDEPLRAGPAGPAKDDEEEDEEDEDDDDEEDDDLDDDLEDDDLEDDDFDDDLDDEDFDDEDFDDDLDDDEDDDDDDDDEDEDEEEDDF
jgi:hypothetical protein